MAGTQQGDAGESKRPAVFKDLSMAQVIAGALASVTSMLLTEQIGIAGGIIGVIVSSVAYTVTAKVYGNMLASSGEKLRDHLGSDVTERISPTTPAHEACRTESAGGTRLMPRPANAEPGTRRHAVRGTDPRAEATRRVALDSEQSLDLTAEGGRIAPPALRAQAADKRQAETRKKVIIVSVVAALAAMAVSALLVTALTAGNGLGTKPSQINSASVAVTDEAAGTKAATTHAAKTEDPTAKTAEAETTTSSSKAEATTQNASDSSSDAGNSSSAPAGNATTGGAGASTGSGSGSASSPQTQQGASTPTAKTEATSASAAPDAKASAR